MNNQVLVRRFIVFDRDSRIAPRPFIKDGVEFVGVTRRQWAAFMYLAHQIIDADYRPTFSDVQDFCGYETPAGARKVVLSLASIGLVRMGGVPGKKQSRSTTITDEGKKLWTEWKNRKSKKTEKVKVRKKRFKGRR